MSKEPYRRFWSAFVRGFFEYRRMHRKIRDQRRSLRNIHKSIELNLKAQEELLKAWDRENELRRDQEEDFQAEREMLHKLLEEANALIDPEAHADWTARVDAVLARCDDAGHCVAFVWPRVRFFPAEHQTAFDTCPKCGVVQPCFAHRVTPADDSQGA